MNEINLGSASMIFHKLIMLLLLGLSSATSAQDALEKGMDVFKSAVKHKDAFLEIDEPKELELGAGMSAQLLGAAKIVDDPAVQNYVNQIGMWLVFQTERTSLPWRFAVLEEDSINAFAAPGGYIFISKGLFMLFRNEAELAAVLAHEIAHVLAKHHLEDIQEKARNGFLKEMGGMVVDDMVGTGWNKLVKQFVNSGVDVWESGLNREDEFEADLMGVVIAARAGYDPYGLAGVLKLLSMINPQQGNSYRQMHATHPPASERLSLLEQAMTGNMDHFVPANEDSSRLYQLQESLTK